ncbi:M15 family metallopeptidase [Marinovum sp. 2_MG-2023]|uniref:M15 family metallopeptidase n=1 Tax=unclassified Marinovum TaxID=2647166 RepID=UPI0026E257EC|nr:MULTISPECIES: M15 family metallopeptidase [unclassified Marinovum]MDO6728621.1 M15 family metallopeptidase [Marinovum sp. 2_MG-2023]MDO6777963.1 M15 family metallopeptidase [Marinovum sp. 1_MG-2023]
MLTRLRQGLLVLGFLAQPALAADCGARDFLAMALPDGGSPLKVALEMAYPGLTVDLAAQQVVFASGETLPLGRVRGGDPKGMLTDGSVVEQFHYRYPLDFDLGPRATPWNDPGRVRNDGFFRALYFAEESAARGSLQKVRYPGPGRATYLMTDRHGVACQLAAAMAEISQSDAAVHASLRNVGGSFNWRVIAGTTRLSAHSFGIALDLNTKYGGYWRWGGVPEGQAGEYRNGIPETVVRSLERYGFIWGGKWHHYDGMHFEYRPELILYARLIP